MDPVRITLAYNGLAQLPIRLRANINGDPLGPVALRDLAVRVLEVIDDVMGIGYVVNSDLRTQAIDELAVLGETDQLAGLADYDGDPPNRRHLRVILDTVLESTKELHP